MEKKLRGEEKLRRVVRELYPDIEFEGEAREWSRMFLDQKLEIATVGEYLKVLEVVMELEELGERVYSYLSGRLTGEGKFLMLELAGLSRSNYVTLKEEYEKVKAIESDFFLFQASPFRVGYSVREFGS
ncbi:hypothetical protein [Thermococcus thioreducens]|uniref:Methyl-accepting chemotaxis protein n=1 Tax=Thermococcus thioreducens TaxID=277988 RepID=A0A0Q2M5W6_9EURY|nr:hypothetical protein [Thermococcus thioreducens]ASJ13281.1 hypothetical protein A3L14_10480 [Thermococcus thioreducens]KQH83306.1 hypothetical protein AMR53_01130 [Thermococcus thioreducens]SEW22021.1 methyl-accepting chemotaxis protein [Thermococcus thioreducens]